MGMALDVYVHVHTCTRNVILGVHLRCWQLIDIQCELNCQVFFHHGLHADSVIKSVYLYCEHSYIQFTML